MDLNTLYHRTVECWADRVNAVGPDQWDDPTPCRDWTVRDLVNHVVGEDRWTVPLVEGRTIADVGTTLDGDLLGDDPVGSALDAARQATTLVAEKLPEGGQVHLSYGDAPIGDYVHELAADHLLHSWDLAVATGGNAQLDPHVTAELAEWFAGKEALYREFGVIGPRAISHGGLQSDLLAAAGRDSQWGPNHAALARLSTAFGRGDVDAIMAQLTDDCAFEATGPAPDGVRHEGAKRRGRVARRANIGADSTYGRLTRSRLIRRRACCLPRAGSWPRRIRIPRRSTSAPNQKRDHH